MENKEREKDKITAAHYINTGQVLTDISASLLNVIKRVRLTISR